MGGASVVRDKMQVLPCGDYSRMGRCSARGRRKRPARKLPVGWEVGERLVWKWGVLADESAVDLVYSRIEDDS